MLIKLRAGEHLWTSNGTHACDEKGFAVVLYTDTEIDMTEDAARNALSIIKAERLFRGVDPETGLPIASESAESNNQAVLDTQSSEDSLNG